MEGNKQISGKKASSTKHYLHRAGTRHRNAKLVFRRDAGKGQWVVVRGLEVKKRVARIGRSERQVVVGKGDYMGIGPKELKKIESMAIKVMPHRCLGGGGYTDGPGNHFK